MVRLTRFVRLYRVFRRLKIIPYTQIGRNKKEIKIIRIKIKKKKIVGTKTGIKEKKYSIK